MKTFSKILFICFSFAFISCSNDDTTANNSTEIPNYDAANLKIEAVRTTGQESGRFQTFNENLAIESFMINISRIEFEFADGFGNGISSPSLGDDDTSLNFGDLPQEIQDYINENYPNDPFCKAEMEDDMDDPYRYEVELESGTELYFNEDFSLYAVEQDDDGCDGNSSGNDDDDDDDDDSDDDFDDDSNDLDYKIFGPFEIDLTNETTTVVEIDIPVAEYEEVEFEMERGINVNSPLYQKSMLMTGTLNGMPFEFFHTFSEDFEIDYEDAGQNLVVTEDNNNQVTFQFDLISVINAVDMANATDGNGNGTIEISPEDTDGNNVLANQIKNAIKQYVDLID